MALPRRPSPLRYWATWGEAEPGFLPRTLAHELGFRVGAAFVGLVAAALALEVDPTVAVLVVVTAVLGPKALHGGPSFDERAVDTEVLAAHERACLSLGDHGAEEQRGHLVLEQSFTMRLNVLASKLSSTMSMSRNQRKSRL